MKITVFTENSRKSLFLTEITVFDKIKYVPMIGSCFGKYFTKIPVCDPLLTQQLSTERTKTGDFS